MLKYRDLIWRNTISKFTFKILTRFKTYVTILETLTFTKRGSSLFGPFLGVWKEKEWEIFIFPEQSRIKKKYSHYYWYWYIQVNLLN